MDPGQLFLNRSVHDLRRLLVSPRWLIPPLKSCLRNLSKKIADIPQVHIRHDPSSKLWGFNLLSSTTHVHRPFASYITFVSAVLQHIRLLPHSNGAPLYRLPHSLDSNQHHLLPHIPLASPMLLMPRSSILGRGSWTVARGQLVGVVRVPGNGASERGLSVHLANWRSQHYDSWSNHQKDEEECRARCLTYIGVL